MRRTRPVLILPLGVALLYGCKGPEPLPEDLDGLIHYVWTGWEDAPDPDLVEVLTRLDGTLTSEELSAVTKGTLSALSLEDVDGLEIDQDPSEAQGLLMARDFRCSFQRLEEILLTLEQDQLYDGAYERYQRTYTGDLEAWKSEDSDRLDWEVEYESTLLGSSYTAQVIGGMRRVGGLPPEISTCGTAFLGRFYLPEPAQFEEGSAKTLDLNFQVEVFYEAEPGRIVHFYGTWQQSDIGAGLTSDSEGVQSVILSSMADWDDQTEVLCEE